ncbi:fucolectin-like [Xenopus tropicalis]|nr:fucolectin-like [Xenopus tropicalis]
MGLLLATALACLLACAAAQNNNPTENLALRGRATQSSTYYNYVFGYLASAINAIDGNMDSNFYHGSCSFTNNDMSPWWRVDLLKSHKISQIVVTNRGDCCGNLIDGAQILVGDSLENNGNNNPSCSEINYLPNGGTQTFECNGMAGRYVNIIIPGKETYLTLCEVQVFGVPVSKKPPCS